MQSLRTAVDLNTLSEVHRYIREMRDVMAGRQSAHSDMTMPFSSSVRLALTARSHQRGLAAETLRYESRILRAGVAYQEFDMPGTRSCMFS